MTSTIAAKRGLRVAAQGTGHSAGPLGSLADTVPLRTDRMRGIQPRPLISALFP